jgi:hypothetical protein
MLCDMNEKKEWPRSVAFSPELWEAIRRSATKRGTKLADEVRCLIQRGLEAEAGLDAGSRLDVVEREIQTIKEQMPSYGRRRVGPRRRAAS